MPVSERDEDYIESGLEALYKTSMASSRFNHDRVREYINVHEFGLALDLLAYLHLESDKVASPETLQLFEDLAQKMGMKDGDEWQGVARMRAARIASLDAPRSGGNAPPTRRS